MKQTKRKVKQQTQLIKNVSEIQHNEIAQQQQKLEINLPLNQFIKTREMTFVYENPDLFQALVDSKKRNESNFLLNTLLEFLRLRFKNVCYRETYIDDIKEILQRSAINCINKRQGLQSYQINCTVSAQIIDIELYSVINCQITEINQSHNGSVLIIVAKGLEYSNLQMSNVFIQISNQVEEKDKKSQQQIEMFKIGQYIPCVVQKVKYQAGFQNINIYASMLKKIDIHHTYVFQNKQQVVNSQLQENINQIIIQQQHILKEMEQFSDDKLIAYLDLLQIKKLNKKTKNQISMSDLQSIIKQQSAKNDAQYVYIHTTLENYIFGTCEQTEQPYNQNYIVENNSQQTLFQLVSRSLRWLQFFYEFVIINSSDKQYKYLQHILE